MSDTGELVVVDRADVGDAVDLMGAAGGDLFEHHIVARIDQDKDLGAGLFCCVDNGELVLRESQRIFAGSLAGIVDRRAGFIGVAFARTASKDDDRGAVALDAGFPVRGSAEILELCGRHFDDLEVGVVAGRGSVDGIISIGILDLTCPRVGGLNGMLVEHLVDIKVLECLVDRQAFVCQRLYKVYRVGVAASYIAARIGERSVSRDTEQRDL